MTIEVLNESGHDLDMQRIARLGRFVMDRMRVHPLAELSVLLVDETAMAELHEKWMDEQGPTDVLSFPVDEAGATAGPRELGDVVICPEHTTDLREAIVHGVLLLVGMDHERDGGEMLVVQAEILSW